MRFLLDQNQPRALGRLLADNGHDAVHVSELGMESAPDDEVLKQAAVDQRILVSADTDFGELLAASNAAGPSVLLFRRQEHRRAQALSELLLANLAVIEDDLNAGAIVVFDDHRIRVRNLPIRR